jgi:hypothetical protein
MKTVLTPLFPAGPRHAGWWPLVVIVGVLGVAACARSSTTSGDVAPTTDRTATAPTPDPRLRLRAGLMDAEQAVWNLRLLSNTPPPSDFVGVTSSDLAFTGNYAIQGNYNGFMVWDISNPRQPTLAKGFVCPASQSDVSVYRNLLFISGEGLGGRLDCGRQGVPETVSRDRLRGIRLFDITDIRNPRYVANVQTCRGSHTHTVVTDPRDRQNIYIYVSGSAGVRPAEELPGCSSAPMSEDANSALFRIEVIRVPLAHPEQAAIVSSPRIFHDLVAAPQHGLAPEDRAAFERAKARGAFVIEAGNQALLLSTQFTQPLLDSIVQARGGSGAPTAADSAALRQALPAIWARRTAEAERAGPRPGTTQCHDITVYTAIGLAGAACEGYGFLLDIADPVNPKRIAAVADSNFAYWHSATFDNDGTKILFMDEWGGSMQPKCRATDPKEWGANAIFTIDNRQMRFRSYYKLPVAQTAFENCVAHNASLIPIPGRDIIVQSWNQGGVSVWEWTNPDAPREIAFFDRGPADSTRLVNAGSWSAYWYNGVIVSSEKARGLDILELIPSGFISQNEIDAAKTVRFEQLNAQDQQRFVWPATFALARAYIDQLERSNGLSPERIAAVRRELAAAESAAGAARRAALTRLATQLEETNASRDVTKVRTLAQAVRELATRSNN